jgi:hypothetical protein
MKEEQILLEPPITHQIKETNVGTKSNGKTQNPTSINIIYSFVIAKLSLRDFNCSCIPHHNKNLAYKPVSSRN